ncbi:MAG TPA: penicillin-binding protein 1C [Gemmatimonadaceae bacterium]|nr:penicillin-binding protein 1C [Gemmatimonadaceae bacterium]
MRRFLRLLATLGLAVGVPAVVVLVWLVWPLPSSLLAPDAGPGVTIEDRHGLPLRSTRAADGSRSRWVPYAEIDADLINAFVAVEDRRFWEHRGIDPRAIARAARDNLRARRVVSGASTITMQLSRVVRPAERTWGGKLAQAVWALRLEYHLGKQQILEQYLNRVHLGQAAVGVGAATALYFGSSASEVSIAQAATLAGLAHAPSRDNPHVSPSRARSRRVLALERMRGLGYATREEVARAREEPLVAAAGVAPFLAPHFTTRVLSWSTDDRGRSGQSPATGTAGGGADAALRTSLDLELQTMLESEVRHTVEVLRDRGVRHAAVVVLDNETGEVLAWVGSPDFWAADDGQTDMVVNARQPGSALKPFLYGMALDRGYTAATVIADIPKTYATATGAYRPRNYDRRFRGPVRAREALASSYNVPAVELAARMGTSGLLHTLHLAGFESLRRDAEHYGLGLALGNGDVTLIELANGYRALANGGEWRPWTWRPVGELPRLTTADSRRVLSPAASAIVLDILRDPAARIPGFGPSTPFDFPFPVAVKTGTSRHFTDNWAVATTRRFTVAVWVGNFSGRPMEGVSGVTGAGPLLHRAVMATSRRVPPGELTTPAEAGAVAAPVCRLSGLRATGACAQLTEWFVPGSEPSRDDDWERGGRVTLPSEYAEWSRTGLRPVADGGQGAPGDGARGAGGPGTLALPARSESEPDSVREQREARFRIISPLDGDRYSVPADVDARYATISLRAVGTGAQRVRWFVDGEAFEGERWPLTPGEHLIRAVSERGESAEVRVVVEP